MEYLIWHSPLQTLRWDQNQGCVDVLRHTYATRAIESGMQPKVLQKLLGHASIKTTMDRYVHVTDDSLAKAVAQFETNKIAWMRLNGVRMV